MKFYFFPNFQKITVGGFVNQLLKNSGPKTERLNVLNILEQTNM